jgi:hypothetical protein
MASLHTQGQSHDRIVTPAGNGALDMPAEPNLIGKPVEVTTSITQKMLSATTGSLLTSLLGMFSASPAGRCIFLRFSSSNKLQHPLTLLPSNTSRCCPRAPASPTKSVSLTPSALLRPASTRPGRECLLSRCLLGAKPVPVLRCCALTLRRCLKPFHVRSRL